ncbi:MAG: endonuclease/exonuclease/phosphatase family protein [Flavobacteriales bacterium]|nr:endonuclease/exonuclease/phosphatase family protein [Flavobacteriales bacterium]
MHGRLSVSYWKPLGAFGLLVLAGLIAWGPDRIWPVLMLRAFAIPMGFAFAAGAGLLLWRKQWLLMAGAVIVSVAAWYISDLPGRIPTHFGNGSTVLKLVQMNVLQTNTDQTGAIHAALAQDPDVICFQEVDQEWVDRLLQDLSAQYPYHCLAPRNDLYGMALFSRLPFNEDTVRMLGPMPAILVRIQSGGLPVRLIAARLRAPETAADVRQRNVQWRQLALWSLEDSCATAVFGDLNTVPWDDAFQAYTSTTGMTSITSMPCPTWPAFSGHAIVPLDHFLLSHTLVPGRFSSFTIPGSDHLGIHVGIGIVIR